MCSAMPSEGAAPGHGYEPDGYLSTDEREDVIASLEHLGRTLRPIAASGSGRPFRRMLPSLARLSASRLALPTSGACGRLYEVLARNAFWRLLID